MRIRPQALRRTRLAALLATSFALFVGLSSLLGWALDNHWLKTGFTGYATMKANTAVALALNSSALLCVLPEPRWAAGVMYARAAALFALAIGSLTLLQHLFGLNFGIDELLFVEAPGGLATTSPGRMGPPAATCLALLSTGILLFDHVTRGGRSTAQLFAAATFPAAILGVIGYATGATQLYGIAQYTGIAAHTALALLLLALGLFLARAERQPAAILVADNPGGDVVRSMLPPAILLPVAASWVRARGEELGLFDLAFGRALLLLFLIVLFTILIWRLSHRLSAVAIQRERAEEATLVEINERKQLQLEKIALLDSERAARMDAERAAALKDQFLATLSHELRTPLNAILGWTSIAKQTPGRPPGLERPLETIERNARVQAQLIEDLLDISRIVSGKLRLQFDRVHLPAVLQSALTTVMPAAEAKQIEIQLTLDPELRPIRGDGARLEQVIWNLLSNAVKFTPNRGSIRLSARRTETAIEISVEDDGKGIKGDFLPHVFDRFRQADSSTTRRHGGLGLGLSIVKQLVELHGGSVRVSSDGEDRGTAFVVSLPTTLEEEGAALPERGQKELAENALEGVSVLVVDDESDAREFVARVLSDVHATVRLAGSVDEALSILSSDTTTDVVVSDIGMPEKDGYDLLRALRQQSSTDGIPVIAVTAFARAEDRERVLEAGFQRHLAKPVDPLDLTLAVAELSRGPQAEK